MVISNVQSEIAFGFFTGLRFGSLWGPPGRDMHAIGGVAGGETPPATRSAIIIRMTIVQFLTEDQG